MYSIAHAVQRTTPAAKSGLAAVLAALALTIAPARADQFRSVPTASGSLIDVQVQSGGRWLPLYARYDRPDRSYFQASEGRTYALRIHNHSDERVGVLIAVDGLNVVNGERSSLDSGEAKYVLGPWETAVIRGWRTSLDEVRQFVFVDEQRSYAERTGQANGDMGWIRVLSFREIRPLAYDDSWRSRRLEGNAPPAGGERSREDAPPAAARDNAQKSEARAQGGMSPEAPENSPGTGWGDRRNDPVRRVEFNAAPYPTDHLVLRYEYESGLRALGILPVRHHRLWERENGQLGFAKPPKW